MKIAFHYYLSNPNVKGIIAHHSVTLELKVIRSHNEIKTLHYYLIHLSLLARQLGENKYPDMFLPVEKGFSSVE